MSLYVAVTTGDKSAVAKLLAQDPSLLNKELSERRFALDYAVLREDVEMVSLLVSHDPSDKRVNARTLAWAAGQGHGDLVAQILAKWPDLITRGNVSYSAVRHNQVAIVAQLFALEPALRDQAILWVWAAKNGLDDILNLVLSHNPPSLVNQLEFQRTALTEAAGSGHQSTVALLLAKQPDLIHIADSNGKTALHYAAEKGNLTVVRQLLDHKPELIDVVDSCGFTALHFAAMSGSSEVIDSLLAIKPELSDANRGGPNALHLAAQHCHAEAFFKLLAQNPRSIDTVTSRNLNSLHFAARGGNPQILEAVLSLRPEFACEAEADGNTALHCLCYQWPFRESEVHRNLEAYLEKIWRLNPSALQAQNDCGQTPLLCSCVSYDGPVDPKWGIEFFNRKLSWDELGQEKNLVACHEKVQCSRVFAEEQCESALSGALISEVIGVVKEYFFGSPTLCSRKRRWEEQHAIECEE